MKFNKKYKIAPEFESLFAFKSKDEEVEHEAKMMMYRFLSELEKLHADKPIKKKELAKKIGTSASYITQLYQGDKLINLTTLAKIEQAFDITFDITAYANSDNYAEEVESKYNLNAFNGRLIQGLGMGSLAHNSPDYNFKNDKQAHPSTILKVA